jgi:hypothetical protein
MHHDILGQPRARADHGRGVDALLAIRPGRPKVGHDLGKRIVDALDTDVRQVRGVEIRRGDDGRRPALGQFAKQLGAIHKGDLAGPGVAQRIGAGPISFGAS